jgi:hypothetical protein
MAIRRRRLKVRNRRSQILLSHRGSGVSVEALGADSDGCRAVAQSIGDAMEVGYCWHTLQHHPRKPDGASLAMP